MDVGAESSSLARLASFVHDECQKRLRAYEAQPRDAAEHFETENEVLSGGYAYRQLYELVQNAADAILESGKGYGRIHVRLRPDSLEAANTGAALDEHGIVALLNARSSSKRGNQIGRFGIGFKSLLKLGGRVDLVSRSVGLRFDPAACRRRIREHLRLAHDAPAPGMRLAEVLDPNASTSPLSEGSEWGWATTVVSAEIRDKSAFQRLQNELAGFPPEFLLFLPADITLDLDIHGAASRRISKRFDGGVQIVSDGETETRWKVFDTRLAITDAEAHSDATHIQGRQDIPLSWAVPLGGRDQAGRFWAFFPTETHSLTAGILNAPWKLNSDRTNLIRGPWNEAIMEAAAGLMAESMPSLGAPDDYGAAVSAFPRQPDRQDEIAVPLVKALWDKIIEADVLPDANGQTRRPVDLIRHSVEDADLCKEWVTLAGPTIRAQYLHPDCYLTRARISRLGALETEAKRRDNAVLRKASVEEWLEGGASQNVHGAKRLIAFSGKLLSNRYQYSIYSVPNARIIPTTKGTLAAPGQVVLTAGQNAPAGFEAVAAEIADDPLCRKILTDQMEVQELADETWSELLEASLSKAEASEEPQDWDNFWRNLASAPRAAYQSFLHELDYDRIKLRSQAGGWAERNLLVVTHRGGDIAKELLLDLDYLKALSIDLPEELMSEFPFGVEIAYPGADELGDYLRWLSPAFGRICRERVGSTPQFLPGFSGRSVQMPAGWRLLPQLPATNAAHLTADLLRRMIGSDARGHVVTIVHPTRENNYPKLSAPHPFYFWLTKHGRLRIANLIVSIGAIELELANALSTAKFATFDLLPAFFRARDEASDLGPHLAWARAKLSPQSVEKLWSGVFDKLSARTAEFADFSSLWELAHADGMIPKQVPTVDGPLPVSDIFVTTDIAARHDLDDGRIVLLGADAAAAWIKSGARRLTAAAILSFATRLSEPSHLLDLFPELNGDPRLAEKLGDLLAVWVEGLEEQLGPRRRFVVVGMDPDGALLVDRPAFERHEWAGGIKLVLECLARHGIVPADEGLEALLAKLLDRRTGEKRQEVRAQAALEDRLLAAVGRDTRALLDILTPATRQAIGDDPDAKEVARLALAVHGPAVLSHLRDVLEAQGLAPPKRWGGEPARTFVLDIGFPLEFASTVGGRRESEMSISGPISLPQLHDYQQDILNDVGKLLLSGHGRRRAVISLPTGGGKTRVAAEAVVQLILRGDGRRSALWIAQTDELCEQAVQCFRQLWVNIGEEGEDLRIVRFWGGQPNPPPSDDDEAVVVIASIQTLNSRSGRAELVWISQAGIVVIDECHHAITASYTDLLRWLDVQVGGERSREREAPVLGLSATPWRGYNEDESERLAARFDRRWLPNDQAGLHDKLSKMGVLAQRSYAPLLYDRPVTLTQREQQHVETFGELPDSVIDRIGDDNDRNDLIVNSVLQSSASSILLFANSVAHAQYLAAKLHLAGCPAAAVSGQTDRLARQHFTRRFRSGELRVICNHSVLTTGFDAPKADMILISRPVFSPVLYMQMVGRGLRGPANGGTDHCEIMTVEDNIVNFQNRLAYHFCRRFFDAQGAGQEQY